MTARAGVVQRFCRVTAVAVMMAWSLTSCQSTGVPAAPPTQQLDRDTSGLVLMPPEDQAERSPTRPAALDPAFAVVSRLSWDNTADFGRPTFEGDQVVLTATSPLSAPIAAAADPDTREAALLAYDADVRAHFPRHPNPPDLRNKRLKLTPERLQLVREHVRVETGTMSIAAIDTLTNEALDFAAAPRSRAADPWGASYDEEVGLVVLSMTKLTPELADALVATFGTDSVAVQVEPNPHAEAATG